MRTVLTAAVVASATLVACAGLANPPSRPPVVETPFGGLEDNHWFDYRTDLLEAEEELRSDLADADDEADVFDARAEYRTELADALTDYQKEAIEAGLPIGRVIFGVSD